MDDDLAARYADFLERIAQTVRSLTVDRVLRWTKLASAALVALVLGITAVVFLVVGVFRLIALWLTPRGAYLALGGLFLVIGVFLWSRRTRSSADDL